jgi:hypothetical protein
MDDRTQWWGFCRIRGHGKLFMTAPMASQSPLGVLLYTGQQAERLAEQAAHALAAAQAAEEAAVSAAQLVKQSEAQHAITERESLRLSR